MTTGERLGSRFQRSRWLNIRLLKAPLFLREPERDLLDLERDRCLDFERFLSETRDLLWRPGERDLDLFLLGDLDLERLERFLDLDLFRCEGDFLLFLEDDLDFLRFKGDREDDDDDLFLEGDSERL